MQLLYYDLVLDSERERASKHEYARFAALAALRERDRSSVRHKLAVTLAGGSRASAAGVRRLDACLADDLVAHIADGRQS
jgi:hypothetical protein